MADLSTKERDALADSDFAVPGKRQLPMHDADHARLAWTQVDRTQGLTSAEKATAKRRIRDRLKELGEPMADDKQDGARIELPTITRSVGAEQVAWLPITRIDEAKREVEAVATSEATDTYRTSFDYEASKKAFGAWAGNVREMHEPKAVGRKVDVQFDDAKRQVVVRSKISKGAQDTWEKVLDGTLSGYSIGGTNGVWEPVPADKRAAGGPEKRCIGYELVELSLVDNASNPDAHGLTIFRGAEAASEAFAELDEPTEQRAGRAISAATSEKLHGMRDHALAGARGAMDTCGCDECGALAKLLDPDSDGDIDIPGSAADTDGDAGDMRTAWASIERLIKAEYKTVTDQLAELRGADTARNQAADIERFGQLSGEIGKVSAVLTAIEGRLATIEQQEAGSGPVVRAVPGLTPVDKPQPGSVSGGGAANGSDRVAVLTEIARNTTDPQVQVFLAAEIMRAQGTFRRSAGESRKQRNDASIASVGERYHRRDDCPHPHRAGGHQACCHHRDGPDWL